MKTVLSGQMLNKLMKNPMQVNLFLFSVSPGHLL